MSPQPAGPADPAAFIRAQTVVACPPLVPEIRLHLATEITPIWQASEASLAASNLPPPYWAFAWPGGQAIARYLLDNPALVRGRAVLDFAAGSGLVAIAAAMSGATRAVANDIDAVAATAVRLNAALNEVHVETDAGDMLDGDAAGFDLVLAGDVCYERPMAERVTRWVRRLAARGVDVLLADPGRAYLPTEGLVELARYAVKTSLELEDRELRETVIYRLDIT
jgi:predicted nicotinamide N-methyase